MRLSFQVKCHSTIHPADPLMVPDMSLVAQLIRHPAIAQQGCLHTSSAQFLGNWFSSGSLGLDSDGTLAQLDYITGLTLNLNSCTISQPSLLF
jgi:hypothetical protein